MNTKETIGGLIFGVGLFYSALLIGSQIYFWLRHGWWLSLPANSVFVIRAVDVDIWTPLALVPDFGQSHATYGSDWKGIKKIIAWLGELHLGIWSACISFGLSALVLLEDKKPPTSPKL